MCNKTDISIIIPAYNEEAYIKRTLKSVKASGEVLKKHFNAVLEIIVVDNESSDDTADIARAMGARVVRESVHNIAKVRNTGAEAANGEFLCFVDADSELSPGILSEVYKAMKSGRYVGGGAKFKLDRKGLIFSLIFAGSVLATHFTGLSGVLIYTSKKEFEEIGGFNENYFAGEDLFFILSLCKQAKKKKLKFKNIYRGHIVTSARKFDSIKFKDLLIHGGLLLHSNLRQNPEKCYSWYDEQYRKER